MLLSINPKTRQAERRRTERLQSFGIDERTLQDILFRSLDRLLPENELVLLMQSRRWREEPDLMAIDEKGDLYIFELKAWESDSSNLLQVLRYGQIFGRSGYGDLDRLFKRSTSQSQSLKVAHEAKFGVLLDEESYNQHQVFVVMTNGLDYRTREAVQYWRGCGLDVRPWIYRAYAGNSGEMLLEIAPFRVNDDPYEDIAEGYHILNTNIRNDATDHHDMLAQQKAAAFFDPWKFKIERLNKGDVVFLYQSGAGIVAMGEADGKLVKAPYQGDPNAPDEEYSMKLKRFQSVSPPLTASEIKTITGIDHVFMRTMFGLDSDSGKAVRKFILDNGRAR